jgi:hypothetical protein
MSYLRFESPERDSDTGQPIGLLKLAYDLLRSDEIGDEAYAELHAHVVWLEEHVPAPLRFSRKRNAYHRNAHGVTWAKASHVELVSRLHEIARLIAQHDIPVQLVRTARPGYIVHEDEWQVVAEPFHGEGR